MKVRLQQLFAIVVSIIFLQSCSEPTTGQWKNDAIDAGLHEKFHQLNNEALKYLKEDNTKKFEYLLSQGLIDDHYSLKEEEMIGNRLKRADFTIYDEYYVVNKWRNRDTVVNNSRGINSYSMKFSGTSREMYIVFMLPKTGMQKDMITLIYCKLNYGWKIAQMDLGPYTINGLTGPELYRLATEKQAKNYLSDAVTISQLANEAMQPSSFIQYKDDRGARVLHHDLVLKANQTYHFPLVINDVPTHPRIFRIANHKTDDGEYPEIYYLSAVSLKDIKAIEKENEVVKKAVGKLIPGIDKDKKELSYCVFNEMPNSQRSVDRYEITQKIDN